MITTIETPRNRRPNRFHALSAVAIILTVAFGASSAPAAAINSVTQVETDAPRVTSACVTTGEPFHESDEGFSPVEFLEADDALPSTASRWVEEATLSWAIKDSFRTYLTGFPTSLFVQGAWQLNSISDSGGRFHWANGIGDYTTATQQGSIAFPGTVQFTGHDGALDLTLSDISVQFHSPTTAVIIATVNYLDPTGVRSKRDAITFANITLTGTETTQSGITVTDAPTTLTAEGATAFGGFYQAGTTLAPLTLTAPLDANTPCDASTGGTSTTKLASSGTEMGSTGPVTALVLLITGFCAVVRSRATRNSHALPSQR